ncbi:MAG: hypothetical protein HZA90_10965, partial [Verrucomicrobia bacterium]|nr:hypothetical protein [Verrucomicrobiota bacterium]
HRYVVTEGGRKIITALLAARQADVEQLTALAGVKKSSQKGTMSWDSTTRLFPDCAGKKRFA